ncbi:NAD(P)H-dependent oxidoreductase [Sporolactobacillus pectinivorans]|uniref:NAD(P)H-dependent oxidoreductase n=1 Tax=Sporolactobacillus pectinivorans TaxID=1591408 RepID=UPI000C258D4D|nr:NAD(P)H-dependent oxidoreductase [Sporolactobacillus pectinivorans]
MKILDIVIHPHLETSTLNRTWMDRLKQENNIMVHDLYGTYPDGTIDVDKEQQLLLEHDRIVFQFPMYWYSSPALLKQWEDDVLTHGWAYGSGGTRLHGKELILAISIGGQESVYQAGGAFNVTISELTRPFQATANLIGMRFLPLFKQYGTLYLSKEEVQNSAEKLVNYLEAEH